MPLARDKIILNGPDFEAEAGVMLAAFSGGLILGDEMIAIGADINKNGGIVGNKLLQEDGRLHLADQESICTDLHDAMAKLIARQRALNDKRRKWLDAEIAKLP